MANIVIVAVVAVGFVLAARHALQVFTGRRDCCGGDVCEKGARPRPRRVEDVDESHYPYHMDLRIAGMRCEGCRQSVEGALDSLPGTWARVDLKKGTARVMSKTPADADAYAAAVRKAGYRVVE